MSHPNDSVKFHIFLMVCLFLMLLTYTGCQTQQAEAGLTAPATPSFSLVEKGDFDNGFAGNMTWKLIRDNRGNSNYTKDYLLVTYGNSSNLIKVEGVLIR
jgi:hypothetical protein